MGVNIGDINIPFVSTFSVDKSSKPTEQIKHLGNVPPHVAEFQADVLKFIMDGTLFQASGDVQDVDQYAEDITALVERFGVYNSIYDYQGRSGWLIIDSGDSDKSANSVLIRDYSLGGRFMPKNKYQARMHTAPAILTNDFSLTLGAGGCDNYVPIPIGATYSGGDGSAITRTGEDGTITLVKATTNKDIKWDLAADEVDVGECKVYDMMDSETEANWTHIYSTDHDFSYSGKGIVIDNGYVRIQWNNTSGYFDFYVYNGSTWSNIGRIHVYGTAHLTTNILSRIITNTPDTISIEIKHSNPADTMEYCFETITISRGICHIIRSDFEVNGFTNPRLELYSLSTKKVAYLNGDEFCNDGIDSDATYTGSKTKAYTTCFDADEEILYGIGSVDNANAQVGIISSSAITEIYQIITVTDSAFIWGILFMEDIQYSSDLTGGMTFSASSIHSAPYNADKAFDDSNEYWITAAGQSSANQWIKVDFGSGNSKTIIKITIKNRSAKGFNSFKLQGSNNDSDWDDVYSGIGSSGESTTSFTFSNTTEYRYYRVYCISGHDVTTLRVTEIEMMTSALYLFKECEDMTQGTGVAYYTGADASPKTGNTGSILNAQNENIYYEFTGGTDLPLGTYKLFLRAKDSAQVADDISCLVRNTTDSTDVMAETTKTLTGSWAYYSFDVTIASDDDTDTIRITLNKETATANTIDLDYVLWVPITLDSGNGPQDIAHQAMVDQNLNRELIAR